MSETVQTAKYSRYIKLIDILAEFLLAGLTIIQLIRAPYRKADEKGKFSS